MYKKVIIILITVAAGFFSGYFSDSVAQSVSGWQFPEFRLSRISWFSDRPTNKNVLKNNFPNSVSDTTASVAGSITADKAVIAVKALPVVQQLLSSTTAKGGQLTFHADQPPTTEYPVWLVELRQVYPNQIPDIMFLKVDSSTGKVLDIQKEELQMSGFKLSSPLPSGSGGGKRLQTRYVYIANLKRKVRLDMYKGFEVESDRVHGVIRVTVTGAGINGPRGLAVGTDASGVVKKFGKANIAQGELFIYNAIDEPHLQLHIKLNKEKVASFSLIKITE